MELTFNEANPFWHIHLPADYIESQVTEIHNEQERQLLLLNLESYIPITNEYYSKSCDELVGILLRMLEDNRRPVSAIIRKHIVYHETCLEVEDIPFECGICYDEMSIAKAVRFNCNHDFCKDCALTHVEKTKSYLVPCPMCRTNITTIRPFQPQPQPQPFVKVEPNSNLLSL
jgi:hypothetical protein